MRNRCGRWFAVRVSLLALICVAVVVGEVRAQGFPTNASEFARDLAGIAGLDKLKLGPVKVHGSWAEATTKLYGEEISLIGFRPAGASKPYFAVVPKDFKLTSFLPVPRGTPIDGVSFNDMAFVVVPKGAGKKAVSTNSMLKPVKTALNHLGNKIDFKDGINLFGEADFNSSGAIKKVLSAVGHTNFRLPLGGVLAVGLFGHDLKTANDTLKKQLLLGLNFKLALPNLKIPGMPDIVSVNNAHLAIVGRDVKGQRKIFAGVTGAVDVTLSGKKHGFSFGILAGDPGKQWKATITGEPKKKLSLPFFHPLDLTNTQLVATRSGGRWDVVVNAKAKLNNKDVDIIVTHNSKDGTTADVTAKPKLTLADLSPGDIPGLADVELDEIKISKTAADLRAEIKGVASNLKMFKHGGGAKPLLSVMIGNLSPASIIPDTQNTPLIDVTFKSLSFLFNPNKKTFSDGGLPAPVGDWLSNAGSGATIKPGFNVYGYVAVHPSGKFANLLKKVGVSKAGFPLNGKFSSKALAKNISGPAIKNAILDALNLDINLPALKIPEVDKFLTFNNGSLKIKGKTPSGKSGIDVAVSGDADIYVKGDKIGFRVDVDYDRSGGNSELSFKGSTTKRWTHPLGIEFLDLDKLTVTVDKKNRKYDIKIADAFFSMKGPLKLSEIPGVKDIPNAGHFEINTLKVSEHGIEAKTDFGGKKDLDVFLFKNSGWNLIVRQDNFTITEIVPPLKHTPLKHIVLSEAAMVLSKDGLTGALSGFSPIAQDALKDIYGKNAANIDVDSGLSLIAAFEHKNAKGGLDKALKRLGLSEERVVLTGGIGGMFGGPTQLNVDVDLSAHKGAKNQPKWMKSKPGAKAVFSLIATETAGQFDIEIGIGVDITASVHGTDLLFDAKVALEFEEEKIDVKIVADLKDKKGWHKPFGIPGFTLYEVGLDLALDEDGAIHLGFDGNIKVSGDTFKVAADADLLPEALGAPQDIAFKASADKVDMFFMEAIAIKMIGGNFNIDIPGGILPTFTKVKFAFVTPGAQDPDLHITGEGFALAGGMKWLGHEVGSMDVSVGPKKGIYASGKIDDLNLGPLHMKNNDFTMDIKPTALPTLKIDSDIKFLGIKERFNVAFGKTGITLDADVKFGPDFSMTSDLTLSGIDISAKHPEFKKIDFSMEGDFKLDIGKFIAAPAKTALTDVYNDLNAAFEAAEASVAGAQKAVNTLTGKINAERAKVRKEKAAAEARVKDAENHVNGLNRRLAGQWSSYHHCHGWHKWPCRIREGIRIGWTKTEVRVADGVLDFVRTLISHFPLDLDPRVAILIGERDTADEALNLIMEALKGADALDGFLKRATDKLTNDIKNSINIHKASFKGDLKGIIEHDDPVDLSINAEFFGATVKDKFAIQIADIGKDLAKDVEKVGLMGIYALQHLVEEGLSDIPGPLKSKLRSAISKKLEAKNAKNKRDLAKYAKEFAQYNLEAAAILNRNTAYNADYLKSVLAKSASPLDSKTSETFAGDYIEVGHTGLCLSAVKGAVKQDKCSDGAASKWSVVAVSGAQNVTPKAGYVNIIDSNSGNCVVPDGTWSTVQVSFSDPKLPKEGAFTFPEQQFQGDGTIDVQKCVNSKEYYWKVLKHGDGWMQMANLASSKCLDFTDSNAIPGKASASYKPCTGAANQVFRVATKVTPTYHKAAMSLRNDAQSACFSDPDSKGEIKMVNCEKAAKYDYLIDIRGYIKFVNLSTGNCLQPNSYNAGGKLVERVCTQLDYQWWAPETVPGAWRIANAQTSMCTHTDGEDKVVTMEDCVSTSQNVISPIVDPKSGISFGGKHIGEDPAHYMAAYPGTQKFGICSMGGMVGSSWLTGTLVGGTCLVALDGKQFTDKGKVQQYVWAVDGVEWEKSSKGVIPGHAIPTGFRQAPKWGGEASSAIAYTCRTKFVGNLGGTKGKTVTGIGWTLDGKTCHYVYGAAVTTTDFEVLTRKASSAFKLQLSSTTLAAKGGDTASASGVDLDVSMIDYLIRYPALKLKFIKNGVIDLAGVTKHWNTVGRRDGQDASKFIDCTYNGYAELKSSSFDPCYYANIYPDIKAAFKEDHTKALHHWVNQGIKEVRQSNAGFSLRAYVTRYDDLRRAFVNPVNGTVGWNVVLDHWYKNGVNEGRNPGNLGCGPTGGGPGMEKNVFDPCFYTNKYPAVKTKFGVNWWLAAHHWTSKGVYAGNQSSVGFDVKSYLMRYDDLRRAFLSAKSRSVDYGNVLNHWWEHGKKEGRTPAPFTCPANGSAPGLENNVFDPCFYLSKYPDLRAAFKTDWVQAGGHWINQGVREGRQSSDGFSIKAYLNRYPDLQRAFGAKNYASALTHWFKYGKKEHRNPRP